MPKIFNTRILLLIFVLLLIINSLLGVIVLKISNLSPSRIINSLYNPSSQEKEFLHQIRNPLSSNEQQVLLKKIKGEAREVETLDTAYCNLHPYLIKARRNTVLTFTNSDKKKHSISLTKDIAALVEPGETVDVFITFSKEVPTLQPIYCDSKTNVSAILYISE